MNYAIMALYWLVASGVWTALKDVGLEKWERFIAAATWPVGLGMLIGGQGK